MIKLLCVCVMLCVSSQGFAEGRKVVDLEFAKIDNKSLKLDLYFPENEMSKMPVVIWIHGGGWLAVLLSWSPGVHVLQLFTFIYMLRRFCDN